MSDVPVDETLFTWPDEPRLIGSTCAACATTTFPAQQSCPRCTGTDVRAVPLATTGRLWSWTVQAFGPKPPYLADGPFEPYGVGYVELATMEEGASPGGRPQGAPREGTVLVESRLTEASPDRLQIGAEMTLTFIPVRRDAAGNQVITFAFAPRADRSPAWTSPSSE